VAHGRQVRVRRQRVGGDGAPPLAAGAAPHAARQPPLGGVLQDGAHVRGLGAEAQGAAGRRGGRQRGRAGPGRPGCHSHLQSG